MRKIPPYVELGKQTGSIDVRLSYRIIELFSEGLYASPNKAIEELVANSFDAGAQRVHVLLSTSFHDQAATIAVIDDGESMDEEGLKQHWLIGVSNKRQISTLPRGRQQIGKFGIGKLATYVLSQRLTHICKRDGRYYSTSMDYGAIERRGGKDLEPKTAISIPLRELTQAQAKQALEPWTSRAEFTRMKMPLIGKGAPPSWTVTVMSSLKDKVHEIKPGILEWVLRTALPLRPDFAIWLNGSHLIPSKQGKGLIDRWTLGKEMVTLPRPCPKGVLKREDKTVGKTSEFRFGLHVPGLGRVTGYAEAYKDLLTGKSDELGRSHGFFVYVFGRLVNVLDGHFGISPDELRHGTFGRFRAVVQMDGLDEELRSNREAISEGPTLEIAQNVLRAIFNFIRPQIEKHDLAEEPGAKLARKLASSPGSLSRRPIVDLARAVVEGKATSRYLIVPALGPALRADFLHALEERAEDPEQFVSGLTIDFSGPAEAGIARYDTVTGTLRINGWHPFVAAFHDEFANKASGQPLEILAMAEVLNESHLHSIGVRPDQITEFTSIRDQLLRNLANESGRESALSVANNLLNARNNPDGLEEKVCAAFRILGFEVIRFGKKGKPDGVATASLPASNDGVVRKYAVSLEAKTKQKTGTKVSAKSVGISAVARQRDDFKCEHAIVVGPAFPTSQDDKSALSKEIESDRRTTKAEGRARTITLITIDDLAKLVRLRPVKQVGLGALRDLFESSLPEDSRKWVEGIQDLKVVRPPYKRIVEAIHALQKKFSRSSVKYGALRVELSYLSPPILYETDEEIANLCRGMAQMSPGAIAATFESVELDQSPKNVVAAIEAATREYLIEDKP
jgi:hypothetical protein